MFEESMFTIHSIWESMNSWFTPAVLFLLLNVVIGTIVFTSTFANKKKHQDSPADLQQQQTQQKFLVRSPSLLQRLKSIDFSGYRSSYEAQSLNLHPKRSSDSDSLFSFDRSSQSQYINSPQNQEKQGSFSGNTQEMQGHYFFEQNPSEITHGKHESVVYQEVYQRKSPENRAQKIKMQENAVRQPEIQRVEEVYSQANEVHVSRSMSDTMPAAGEIIKKLPAKLKKSASLKSAFKHFEEEDILEARRPATVKDRRSSKVADVDEGVDAKADDFINKFKQQLKLQRLDSIIRYKEMVGRGSNGE